MFSICSHIMVLTKEFGAIAGAEGEKVPELSGYRRRSIQSRVGERNSNR